MAQSPSKKRTSKPPYVNIHTSENSHAKNVAQSLSSLVFGRAKLFERSLTKKRIILAVSSLVFFIVIGTYFAPKGAAESAMFYPTSCLGGWMNPGMAEGQPQTTGNDHLEQFNPDNSAVLAANTRADIYCGSFKGTFPEKTKPTKILLSLSWTTGLVSVSSHTKIITGSSFASSTTEILDSTSSDLVSFTAPASISTATSTSPLVSASDEIVSATPTPALVTTDNSSSLFNKIITTIKNTITGDIAAPTPTPTVVPVGPSDTTPAPNQAPPAGSGTSTPTSFLDSLVKRISLVLVEKASAEQVLDTSTTTPSTSISATTTTVEPVVHASVSTTTSLPETITPTIENSSNPFLEVLYTFDGITWMNLGKVNETDMASRNFEIPVTASTTWDDMSHLQVKVTTLERFDQTPAVSLDGMKVEVLYGLASDGSHPDFSRDTVLQETKDNGIHAVLITNIDTLQNEIWYMLTSDQPEIALATSTWLQFSDLRSWPTKESIIYSLTDHSPPAPSKRVLDRKIIVDPAATHSCHAETFHLDISGISTSSAKIFFKEDEQASYTAEIGSLPDGINIMFEANNAYEYYPTQDDTSLVLKILNDDRANKGNFTVPIIFTKNLGHESTIMCQINIVNL